MERCKFLLPNDICNHPSLKHCSKCIMEPNNCSRLNETFHYTPKQTAGEMLREAVQQVEKRMSKDTEEKLNNMINWDNWEDDNGEPMEVTAVLFSRLQWMKEYLIAEKKSADPHEEVISEHLDTIELLEVFVTDNK